MGKAVEHSMEWWQQGNCYSVLRKLNIDSSAENYPLYHPVFHYGSAMIMHRLTTCKNTADIRPNQPIGKEQSEFFW